MTETSEVEPLSNRLIPFMIEQTGVHGRIVRMGTELDAILSAHRYPDMLSKLLGELVVIVALLGNNLKRHGILTAQIRGDGPVTLVVADITRKGHIRGYAEADREALRSMEAISNTMPTLEQLCGEGYLAITLDGNTAEDRYQGIVALEGESLSVAIMHYLHHSEQVEAALKVALGKQFVDGEEQWCAGAIILQQLPDKDAESTAVPESHHTEPASDESREERWNRSRTLMNTVKDHELLDAALPVKTLLYNLFHEDGVAVFPDKPLKQQCRCSREKVEQVVASLPEEELDDLLEDGRIRLTCRFCSTEEVFTPEEVVALRGQE